MKAVALSLLAAAVAANEFRTVTVTVDNTKVDNLVNDYQRFDNKLRNATHTERENLQRDLANAFQTGVGKLVLNFGKTVVPVAKDWANVLETTAVEDGCDYDCATNMCIDQENPLNIDFDCLEYFCDCNFLLRKMPQEEIYRRLSKAQDSEANLKNFLNERG